MVVGIIVTTMEAIITTGAVATARALATTAADFFYLIGC